ncbi:hypothetical protein [Rhizomonospora bruguierae]|uniref:hypothetical protein n=1 Tax=Rhizomonospora bruguierae TaxID=1581705 RepID=UPI001BD125F9|nr:hypothetical protein [Micromonospora sp. NBRC 107566]
MSSANLDLTGTQRTLLDDVCADPDGRDTRDLLIAADATARDKAAVAEVLGGPGAGREFADADEF